VNIRLLLITLARKEKSQETFNLTRFRDVIIKVAAHRARAALKQCHNSQNFH
jgi:hypothetical protein